MNTSSWLTLSQSAVKSGKFAPEVGIKYLKNEKNSGGTRHEKFAGLMFGSNLGSKIRESETTRNIFPIFAITWAYYLSIPVKDGRKSRNMNRNRVGRNCNVSITNACCVQGASSKDAVINYSDITDPGVTLARHRENGSVIGNLL